METKQGQLRTLRDFWSNQAETKDRVIINRLRLGHSQLSHGHLKNSEVQEPLRECPACMNGRLTIKHNGRMLNAAGG